ncbi:Fe2OG dioxygenase domain-containing protein [Balamuthia mandrillaris]
MEGEGLFGKALQSERTEATHTLGGRKDILDGKGWLLYGVFSREECHRLIKAAEAHGWEGKFSGERRCLRIVETDEQLSALLLDRVKDYLPQQVVLESEESDEEEGEGASKPQQKKEQIWQLKGMEDTQRICKYLEGHYFGPHIDQHIWPGKSLQSLLTIMVYLNDCFSGEEGRETNEALLPCFEGGHTNFFEPGSETKVREAVAPQAGMAIVFYQGDEHDLYHEGAVLTNGCKYMLRTNILYQRVA